MGVPEVHSKTGSNAGQNSSVLLAHRSSPGARIGLQSPSVRSGLCMGPSVSTPVLGLTSAGLVLDSKTKLSARFCTLLSSE